MADWGMKVSKSGSAVLTAATKDLLFTTQHNTVKIDPSLSTLRTASGGGTGTITHSYGYKPFFMCFFKSGSYWYPEQANANCTTSVVNISGLGASANYRVLVCIDEVT